MLGAGTFCKFAKPCVDPPWFQITFGHLWTIQRSFIQSFQPSPVAHLQQFQLLCLYLIRQVADPWQEPSGVATTSARRTAWHGWDVSLRKCLVNLQT